MAHIKFVNNISVALNDFFFFRNVIQLFYYLSYRRINKSVVFTSSLYLFPGADTTTIFLASSELTMSNTFLICSALETELPPNFDTFIMSYNLSKKSENLV